MFPYINEARIICGRGNRIQTRTFQFPCGALRKEIYKRGKHVPSFHFRVSHPLGFIFLCLRDCLAPQVFDDDIISYYACGYQAWSFYLLALAVHYKQQWYYPRRVSSHDVIQASFSSHDFCLVQKLDRNETNVFLFLSHFSMNHSLQLQEGYFKKLKVFF